MEKLLVRGGKLLKGEVSISGSKNASLPIIAACTLIKGTTILKNVPNNRDVSDMLKILENLGAKVIWKENIAIISISELTNKIDYKNIRASYYFWGALLSRYGSVEGFNPGGCNLGERPIDIHIDAFRKLGYNVSKTDKIRISGYVSNFDIILKDKSVGATINAILASLNSSHEIIIRNTLIEPEAKDLINFLNKVGFQIERILDGVKITPRNIIKPVEYEIMFDRIEAISYITLGLLTGNLVIKNVNYKYIKGIIEYLVEKGAKIKVSDNIYVKKSKLDRMDFVFDRYPAIPTDLNPILSILLIFNNGGNIIDRVFPQRYKSILALKDLGANIDVDNYVKFEKSEIIGGTLKGLDLRGDMAFLIFSLKAKSKFLLELQNIDRGYPDYFDKIKSIRGKIKKVK